MTRHELKTQDEITTTLQKVIEFAEARQKELLMGGGALLVIVLAVTGWSYYSSSRNASAQAQLADVMAAFNDPAVKSDKERYEKTIDEAQKTTSRYGSLPAGIIAKYYMGLSQDGLGDSANAEKNLQEVIARGDANTRPVAQFALGEVFKHRGEFQKAIDILKPLHDSGAYSKAAVALELGKVYEANKQPDQAKGYYNEVITDLSDSPFKADAEAGLKRMGLPMPTPGAAKPATPAP
jgi:predicted negative regulator of RcsB-dependent stress response